ncbi:MAG: hypothetical protein CVU90_02110 [Firmicutes bacterium HGW-Firmicutes-15]|nr:MAG: hypothetical protein CVU90_02110 [Firmicutes bacterium HGW-Firmicutes-15]
MITCLLGTFIAAPLAAAVDDRNYLQGSKILPENILYETCEQIDAKEMNLVASLPKSSIPPRQLAQLATATEPSMKSMVGSVYGAQSQRPHAAQSRGGTGSGYSGRTRVKLDLQVLLAANENPEDTDEDELPDAVEGILGTNPDNADSDFDELKDIYEVQNGLDPMNPDSNDDGLSDYVEIADNGQYYPDKDSDSDGIPDVWDEDNDGDGVPDRLDISPFTYADVNSSYHITNITNQNATYLDFQVQPEPRDYLNLHGQTWNWPLDEKGFMQNSDGSTDDVKLVPMLELKCRSGSGKMPRQEEVKDYGIIIKDSDTACIPLNPVSDAGKKTALNGRMFFPAGGASKMDFDTKMVWAVEGKREGICDPAPSEMKDVLNFSWETAGSGIDIADLDGNGQPDMLLMAIDNPEQDNTFRYMIGWDLDTGGTPRMYSQFFNVGNIGWEHQGGGVALYDLNKDGQQEVIMMGIDNPEGANRFRYRVGSEINANGKFQNWSGLYESEDLLGNTCGGGVAVRDINDNETPDLILMAVNDLEGGNSLSFMVGWDLDANGKVTGGYSQYTTDGILGDRIQGAGLAVTDLDKNGRPEYIIDTVDDPDDANRHNYLVAWNVDTTGIPQSISQRYVGDSYLLPTCAGGGLALYDINNNGQEDMALLAVGQVNKSANQMHVDWGMDLAAENPNIVAGWGTSLDIPPFLDLNIATGGPQDTGAAAADLDGNGQPDIVLTALQKTTKNYEQCNYIQYSIGWNMDAEGNVKGWSPLKQYDLGTEASGEGLASGASLYDVNGDNKLDLIIMGISKYEKQDSAHSISSMWYKIGWSLDSAGNVTGGWSSFISAPNDSTRLSTSYGAGISMEDINGNGTPEIVLLRVTNDYSVISMDYRIGWDIDRNGNPAGWSDAFHQQLGEEANCNIHGGDVLLGDFNNNGTLDLLTMALIYTNKEYRYRYQVGWDLAVDGTVSNRWSGIYDIPLEADGYSGGALARCDLNGNGNEEVLFTNIAYWGNNAIFKYKTAWDVGGNNNIILAKYTTPYRLTGFKAEENYQADAAIFYSTDKGETTRAYVDLRYDFLDSGKALHNANYNLEAQEICVANKMGSYPHADAALQAINREFINSALSEFPADENMPVIIATEEKYADKNMDEYGNQVGVSLLPGNSFTINTQEVAPSTIKSLKMSWFNRSKDDALLQPEEFDGITDKIAQDYSYDEEERNELLKLLLVWNEGESRLTGIGGQDLFVEATEDEKLKSMNNVRTGMAGLKGLMLMKVYSNGMGFVISSIQRAGYTGNSIIPAIKSMGKYVSIIKGARVAPGSIARVENILGRPLSKTQIGKFSTTSRFAKGLRIGGAVLGSVMALYSFFDIASAGGWSNEAISMGMAYAGMTMLYMMMLEMISELPGGVIIAALVILSDLITNWVTGEGWSQRAMSWLCDAMTQDTYQFSIMNLDTLKNDFKIDDQDDNGMDVGDSITIHSKYQQTLEPSSRDKYGRFVDDYIKPQVYFSSSDKYTQTHKVTTEKDPGNTWTHRQTYYQADAQLTWNQAGINIPVQTNFRADYHVATNDSDIVDYNQSCTTLYFDVLPGSLEDFLAWDAISKNDSDGDGLLNPEGNEQDEDGKELNTSPYSWDSDSDELSDRFELDKETDPWSADSDRDHLTDREEYLLGTDPNNWDSDSDGLTDAEELEERTITVHFCGEDIAVKVTSDPLCNDSDGDGRDDKEENDSGLNPSSRDTDGDGQSDAEDSQPRTYQAVARIRSTDPLILNESPRNDGSIEPNTVTIELANGTFNQSSLSDCLQTSNLPEGLSIIASRDGNRSNCTISIRGYANKHAVANDIDNLTITIPKEVVNGAENDLTTPKIGIHFTDTTSNCASLESTTPTELNEAAANDGSLNDGTVILTIKDGILANDIGRGDVSAGKLPDGMDFMVNRDNDTQLTIQLTGQARYHRAADSVSCLTFTISRDKVEGALYPLTSQVISINFHDLSDFTGYASNFTEALANDGSLKDGTIAACLENGTLAEDISENDVSSEHLPAGMDYIIDRTDPVHLTITITGKALNHGNADDLNDLNFIIRQDKVIGAKSDLTIGNIQLDFYDLTPEAPTDPIVDDANDSFAWTNTTGFENLSDYEYSLDSGANWLDCTNNPQSVGDVTLPAGTVGVRVKSAVDPANGNAIRPVGTVLASDKPFNALNPGPWDITGFIVANQVGESVINKVSHSVSFHMPMGSKVSQLKPIILLAPNSTVSPPSGEIQDFSKPAVLYTVYAQNTAQPWLANCIVDTIYSQACEITGFTVPGQVGESVVNTVDHTVTFHMPPNTYVGYLLPTITLSEHALISPRSGVRQNFANPVFYRVTAEDGQTSKDWIVICNVDSAGAASIESTWPLILNEATANDGSLKNGALTISIRNGTLAAGISKADLTAVNLPAGFDYNVIRTDDMHLIIIISGKAIEHASSNSISDLKFTINKDKVSQAESDLTTGNISIDFKDPGPTAASIDSTTPTTLHEAAANDGSLDPETIVLEIADGTLAADISESDVTAANLPAGLSYSTSRNSDSRLTISISENAINHSNSDDISNLRFIIPQAKVSGSNNDLISDNISIDFNNQAASAPTNPVVNDSQNTFGWSNVAGICDADEYEYSKDGGVIWMICETNPQTGFKGNIAADQVRVRVKADPESGRPAGAELQADKPFTAARIYETKPTALQEAADNNGSLASAGINIIIENGEPSSDISKENVTAENLPPGFDFTVKRMNPIEETRVNCHTLIITITGQAINHSDADDANNLRFTIAQGKVNGADSDLTTENICIDFNDPVGATTLSKPGQPLLANFTASWTAVDNENNGYRVQLYKDGIKTGAAVNIIHGEALSHDFSSSMAEPGSYTVTVTAGGKGVYVNSPESDPSDPQVIKDSSNDSGSGGGSTSDSMPPQTQSVPNTTPAVTVQVNGSFMALSNASLDKTTGTVTTVIQENNLKNALAQTGTGEITTLNIEIPEIPGANSYVTDLPAAVLTASTAARIEIKTSIGTISLPGNMLVGNEADPRGRVSLEIGMADKSGLDQVWLNQITDKPVIELKLMSEGKTVSWKNTDTPVTVSIPYTPTAEEMKNPEHITVWYINGAGNIVPVTSGKYDAAAGVVSFQTTHFSKYTVAYVNKTFKDLGNHSWAKKQIEVLASKGIINGSSRDTFSPAACITRADYLVLLVKTLGLTAHFENNFDDIKPGSYYYDEVGITKKLGITSGLGNNKFKPAENISRQDMMVLTARALTKYKKLEAAKTSTELDKFKDQTEIAGYAQESLTSLVKAGLISGTGNAINPRANTTRAEAAVFLYKIYNR